MPEVLLNVGTGELRSFVVSALADRGWTLRHTTTGAGAGLAVARILVIGTNESDLRPLVRGIVEARESRPDLDIAVVGLSDQRIDRFRPRLAMAGADVAVTVDADGGRELTEWIFRRNGSSVDPEVIRSVLASIAGSPRTSRVAGWALRAGDRHHTVGEAADWFGVDRKTLYRECMRNLHLSVGEILTWGRYLRFATLSERGFSYQQIADRLGYETPSAVANLRKRWRRHGVPSGERIPQ
ncbi:MAG: hypothetical protein ACT4OZ_05095 [Gemmatimonadota bacterium]